MFTTFADMFGDGLQHWVVITNGEVQCWPNLGRGRFGEPVIFDNVPRFGAEFDARRIRLLDADGSGCADILYLQPDHIALYRNQNGNGFSAPVSITPAAAGEHAGSHHDRRRTRHRMRRAGFHQRHTGRDPRVFMISASTAGPMAQNPIFWSRPTIISVR